MTPRPRSRSHPRRRERGSTILYAVILSGVAATLAVANLQVAASARRLQNRREEATRWEYVKLAAQTNVDKKIRDLPGLEPSPTSFTAGGASYTVTASPSGKPKLYNLAVVGPGGWTVSTTVDDPRGKHPFLYGLYVDGDSDIKGSLYVGSASNRASAYFQGNVKLAASETQTVFGALEVGQNSAPDFDDAGDCVTTGVTRPPVLTPNASTYATFGDQGYVADVGFSDGSWGNGSETYVVTCAGKASLTGTFYGRCTIYAAGEVTIRPPLLMGNASSKLVIVTSSNVKVQGAGRVQAFVYARGNFEQDKKVVEWTGAIACKGLKIDGDLTILLDPSFYETEEIGRYFVPLDGYGLD